MKCLLKNSTTQYKNSGTSEQKCLLNDDLKITTTLAFTTEMALQPTKKELNLSSETNWCSMSKVFSDLPLKSLTINFIQVYPPNVKLQYSGVFL